MKHHLCIRISPRFALQRAKPVTANLSPISDGNAVDNGMADLVACEYTPSDYVYPATVDDLAGQIHPPYDLER
jgi:hypothetical protein